MAATRGNRARSNYRELVPIFDDILKGLSNSDRSAAARWQRREKTTTTRGEPLV